jgi:limonene-1,2-epoxide hydrolase
VNASEVVVRRFIDDFIQAWPRSDVARVSAYFSEDAIYHNIPMEPAVGRAAIESTFGQFMKMGGTVSVELSHILASDTLVMTERVDHFISAERTITLEMMGICEIHNGLITAWRDYFDLNQLSG